ncbi:8-amino-7-oxononanoate synthase [Marinicella sp. S1101]|uniref:aminotransferase class I/II-fold pyridoxal phosphate-dependent enzyme n=1 Tax=Marinicella marina TaxID=2996016 RepID=UPI002260EC77|nr:8-amino-7-oxononanoate synthase [Marinicella marina]MCX7553332.1 8-amino-7-oxononanoate synthase [Marinicella marina]MDJ1139064.1 8-amino-7-oxononanoate synthase [Marinicella marina]
MSTKLEQQLEKLKADNLFRQRMTRTSKAARYVSIEGRQMLNFNSNDYLGLANHPEVLAAAQEASQMFGFGATGSPLMSGYTSLHQELEYAMADFLGYPKVVLFSAGYLANIGIAQAFLKRNDWFIQDRLNHASLIDAAHITGAELKRYPHLNNEKAEAILKDEINKFKLWATEGVFSMDGDSHDLFRAALSAHTYNALLWVDDCHGVGVLGDNGRGVLDTMTLSESEVPILSGTFGKAFGTCGAYVAGSETLIETIIQKARTYKYNTALPVPVVAATLKALELIKTEPWRREKVADLIYYYKKQCDQYGLAEQAKFTDSAIQPIMLKSETAALEKSDYLKTCGIITTAIRPPTVPKNQCRLRITLNSELEREDIDLLIQCLIGNY